MSIVKNRPARDGELIPAGIAVVLVALGNAGNALGLAPGAGNAGRTTKLCQTMAAFLVGAELLHKRHDVHARVGI